MPNAIFQIPDFSVEDGVISINNIDGEPCFSDYEVQTNPSKITLTYSRLGKRSKEKPLWHEKLEEQKSPGKFLSGANKGKDWQPQSAVSAKLSVQKRIKMTLEMDLVNVYDSFFKTLKRGGRAIAATASVVKSAYDEEGLESGIKSLFKEASKPRNLSEIDLFTDDNSICIFSRLKEAAEYCLPVRFVWGSIMTDTEYFEGRIEELDANINYFSAEWNALRASVNITIKES